jgi:hypothetical protein
MRCLALLAAFALCACDDPDSSVARVDMALDAGLDDGIDQTVEPDTGGVTHADVVLQIDWTPQGAAGRFVGWNIGRGTLYGPPDSPTHPEWRTSRRTEALSRLRTLRSATGEPPYMRFSGLQIDGALGNDGYHFWDFVDPERGIADTDNMAPFEYFALFEEVDAEPIIMVNFGSGTAEEAGRYVRHLVGTDPADPLVAARAHWGRADPYPVRVIELGNEVYAAWNTGFNANRAGYAAEGNDPDWTGRPSSNAADYAARALTYIEAILPELPDAEFWIPLSQADMVAWGGTDAALRDLAPVLNHPSVGAVVVHHYHVDDTGEFGGADKNDPGQMMTLSERYRPLYLELRAALAELERPLEIAITEYHVAGAFARGRFEQGDTAAIGLGMADMLIAYAQLGIEHLCQHMALNYTAGDSPGRDLLFEPWYPPYRVVDADAPLVPRAHTVVQDLFARHVRARRAAVAIAKSPQVAGHGGDWSAVHAAAFADEGEGTLVMLHRDQTHAAEAAIELAAGDVIESIEAFAPAAVDATDGFEPQALPWQQEGATVRLTLPPHSVIAIRVRRP